MNIASSSTTWKPIACQNRRAVTGSTPAPSDTSRRPIEAGRPSSTRSIRPATSSGASVEVSVTPSAVGTGVGAGVGGGVGERLGGVAGIGGQTDILRGHRASSPSGQRDRTWMTSPADTADQPSAERTVSLPASSTPVATPWRTTPPGSCTSTSRPTVAQAAR